MGFAVLVYFVAMAYVVYFHLRETRPLGKLPCFD